MNIFKHNFTLGASQCGLGRFFFIHVYGKYISKPIRKCVTNRKEILQHIILFSFTVTCNIFSAIGAS